jgi:SAM-dependent methyltransferase
MALTAVDYHVLEALRKGGLLPRKPALLELGESEWYGDAQAAALIDDVVADAGRRAELKKRLAALRPDDAYRAWHLAKIFYAAFLDYSDLVSIDFHGTPAARAIDLNHPVELGRRFDIVIDSGTAEHVFNVAQFFRTCHEVTAPGGLMLHNNPFRGWLEHGFYNFNPTFYWDVAVANRYEVLMLVYSETQPLRIEQLLTRERVIEMARAGALGPNALLYAVYRKPRDEAPFAIPRQAYYANVLSEQMARAWIEVR